MDDSFAEWMNDLRLGLCVFVGTSLPRLSVCTLSVTFCEFFC